MTAPSVSCSPPGVASVVVSQGCRPVGPPWVVTDADRALVRQLGGRPALERLQEIIDAMGDVDRRAAARGLHVGLVANEQQATFETGDFLIRNLVGADKESGAIQIGEEVDIGQVVRFQVRDAVSASDELGRLLGAAGTGRSAVVFTCNGRGTNLFDRPHHDAALVSELIGPAAGMFCAGELGPIADRNAIHAFTATVVVLR